MSLRHTWKNWKKSDTWKNSEEYSRHGTSVKVWHALESATAAPDDEADLPIEDLLNLLQQTVLLVGQTNNAISYRRLSALAGAIKISSQTKSMIKDKSALLENSGK